MSLSVLIFSDIIILGSFHKLCLHFFAFFEHIRRLICTFTIVNIVFFRQSTEPYVQLWFMKAQIVLWCCYYSSFQQWLLSQLESAWPRTQNLRQCVNEFYRNIGPKSLVASVVDDNNDFSGKRTVKYLSSFPLYPPPCLQTFSISTVLPFNALSFSRIDLQNRSSE